MNKTFFIGMIGLLACLHLSAQPGFQKITGHVRDSSGQPVAFGSVVASGCADGRILAFATTDEKGMYDLKLPAGCDTIALTARGLGYRADTVLLAWAVLPPMVDFVLSSIDLALREVVVRERTPPVVVRSDTTEFHVASFTDSTEFSVEDVLRKLPGVRVDGNGQITYNNKPVERVLIEGDDLFSQNYTLATRNLRAGMISKVQAIDRFQENPLMKGVQESDRLVLNLVIKEEKKRATSGSAMAGGGFGDEWKGYTHLNLFSLTRRDKTYLIGHADNTGDNALREVEFLSRGGRLPNNLPGLQNSPLNAQPLLQPPQPQNVGLPEQFTRLNRGGLLFLGHVLSLSPVFRIKMSGWLLHERVRQDLGTNTRFLLDTATLDIIEKQQNRRLTKGWHLQAESEYYATGQKHALRCFFRIDGQPEQYDTRLLRNQPSAAPQSIDNDLAEEAREFFISAEYTWKTAENTAFQIAAKTTQHRRMETLQSNYAFYPPFFGLDSTFTDLFQEIRQSQGQTSLTARLLTRRHGAQWLLETGANWQWGSLTSAVTAFGAMDARWSAPNAYANDFNLATPRYFGGCSVTRPWNAWVFQLRMRVVQASFRFADPVLPNSALWIVSPDINMRYSFSESALLSANYHFIQESPDFTDLYPGYLFTDYQTLSRGLPAPALMPSHSARINYRYNDRMRQFSWNIGGSLTVTDNGLGVRYAIDPFLSVQDRFRPVHSERYALNAAIDRFIPPLSANIEAGASVSLSHTLGQVNSDALLRLDTRVYTAYLECGTAFDSWVNVILSNQLTRFDIRNTSESTSGALHTANWFSSIKVTVKPSRRFDAYVQVHQANNRADDSRRGTWFHAAEGTARLRLPRWKSEIQLTAVNLFNSRRYEQAFADTFFQTTSVIQASARFFRLTWSFDF